ncbi:Uncharacterised protein [Pseudomonas aeruginosa]|nr:Uncharacterised protein [Pseudomonas aeruginosa]
MPARRRSFPGGAGGPVPDRPAAGRGTPRRRPTPGRWRGTTGPTAASPACPAGRYPHPPVSQTGTSHRDPADVLAEQQHVGLDQLQGFAHGASTLQRQPGDAIVGKAVVFPQAQAFQGGAPVQHDPLVERFAGQARLGSRTLAHVRRRDALHGEVVVEWSPLEIVLDVFGRAHRLPLARDAIALKASGLRYSMRMSFRLIFVRWASGNHYLA